MQKPLKSAAGKKKQGAANRHGKLTKVKRGRLEKDPRRPTLQKDHVENKKLTKIINETNEERFAGVASNMGGRLGILKAPFAATADDKGRKNRKPGLPFGASKK